MSVAKIALFTVSTSKHWVNEAILQDEETNFTAFRWILCWNEYVLCVNSTLAVNDAASTPFPTKFLNIQLSREKEISLYFILGFVTEGSF